MTTTTIAQLIKQNNQCVATQMRVSNVEAVEIDNDFETETTLYTFKDSSILSVSAQFSEVL